MQNSRAYFLAPEDRLEEGLPDAGLEPGDRLLPKDAGLRPEDGVAEDEASLPNAGLAKDEAPLPEDGLDLDDGLRSDEWEAPDSASRLPDDFLGAAVVSPRLAHFLGVASEVSRLGDFPDASKDAWRLDDDLVGDLDLPEADPRAEERFGSAGKPDDAEERVFGACTRPGSRPGLSEL